MNKYWYKTAYHRSVVDMHITCDDDEFLTKFDADSYVEMIMKTHAESAVVYANSHVGMTTFPTQYGYMNPNLKGRDIFGEIKDRFHAAGINVVAYISLIFDTWAYDNHPQWRMRNQNGGFWTDDRYGVCCPNSDGYRKYIKRIITELCDNYDFEGIRFDMTFWPGFCYCEDCRRKFAEEYGCELPKTINWWDKTWVAFQRSREKWLVDFARDITDTVRRLNPSLTVEHQSSVYNAYYGFGVSADLREQSDFLQGDFYGGYIQGSSACKLFYNLTPNLPFGFETSANESLADHTTLKSESMLELKACMAIANGGAFVFIDAIDPVGTLNPHVYDTMSRVFAKTKRFEPYVGGELIQDAAIYLSTESKFDFAENGKNVAAADSHSTHIDATFNASRALIKNHIPFGIITRKNLGILNKFRVIILPDVLMMSAAEIDAFREYVANGGRLYASKYTSLTGIDGEKYDNFKLADVFGADYRGITEDGITYMTPRDYNLFPDYITETHPLFVKESQLVCEARPGVRVAANLCKPYFVPQKRRPFASIHSDPPGKTTDYASMTLNKYKSGVCIYSAAPIEDNTAHDRIFAGIIKYLLGDDISFEGAVPRQVEVTMFDCGNRVQANFLTFQEELPNLPIPAFCAKIKTGGRKVKRVVRLPENEAADFSDDRIYAVFTVGGFDNMTIYSVEFE